MQSIERKVPLRIIFLHWLHLTVVFTTKLNQSGTGHISKLPNNHTVVVYGGFLVTKKNVFLKHFGIIIKKIPSLS